MVRCDAYPDRACPVCYYTYLEDYLSEDEKVQLFQISGDCRCDFDDEPSHDDVKKKIAG